MLYRKCRLQRLLIPTLQRQGGSDDVGYACAVPALTQVMAPSSLASCFLPCLIPWLPVVPVQLRGSDCD
jgi:hypothetical protein